VLHRGAASLMSGETSTGAASALGPPDQAWRTANANLAETVRRTQERLDRNEGEKKELERQLREAKAKLAAADDGGAPPRNEFDLTQDDWKQLARTGTVKARYPCDFDHDWTLAPEQGARLALSPSDVAAVEKAVKAEDAHIGSVIMDGCARVLHDADLAQRLGPRVCDTVVGASVTDPNPDLQLVANVMAGNTPMPPAAGLDPFARLMFAETGATAQLQADLTAALGPEEAHRIAVSDELGSCSGTSGPGAKP
jgi:hypothetical protein